MGTEPDLVWLQERLEDDALVSSLASLASRCACPEALRATAWRLFFEVVDPRAPDDWAATVASQRERYREMRDGAMARLAEAMEEALDDESEGGAAVEDAADQIRADLERCFPEGAGSHFMDPARQKTMFHILLAWAVNHERPGYRQGMHELLANLLWVFEKSFAATAIAVLPPESPLNALRVDLTFLEEDVYWLFDKLVDKWTPLYDNNLGLLVQDDNNIAKTKKKNGPSLVVQACERVQSSRLGEADPELRSHLASFSSKNDAVLPQVYMLSWLRLGFSRLLSIDDVAKLWDAFFAPPGFNGFGAPETLVAWLESCAVLLLVLQREKLLRADTGAGCLQILLRVVSPEPLFLSRHARRLHGDRASAAPIIASLRTQANLAAVLPSWLLSILGSVGLVAAAPRPSYQPRPVPGDDSYFTILSSTSNVLGRVLSFVYTFNECSVSCSCLLK